MLSRELLAVLRSPEIPSAYSVCNAMAEALAVDGSVGEYARNLWSAVADRAPDFSEILNGTPADQRAAVEAAANAMTAARSWGDLCCARADLQRIDGGLSVLAAVSLLCCAFDDWIAAAVTATEKPPEMEREVKIHRAARSLRDHWEAVVPKLPFADALAQSDGMRAAHNELKDLGVEMWLE